MTESAVRVEVLLGDITTLPVDAIVNAANSHLAAGGGVCGAIFDAAGHAALSGSCRAIGGCPTGSAVVTPSHRLAERGISHIIHAVGPVWDEARPELWPDYDRQLAGAYRTSLEVAEQVGARSIAFPSISTGIYGFPKPRAAAIAVAVTTGHVGSLERIVLTAFDTASFGILSAALASVR